MFGIERLATYVYVRLYFVIKFLESGQDDLEKVEENVISL